MVNSQIMLSMIAQTLQPQIIRYFHQINKWCL